MATKRKPRCRSKTSKGKLKKYIDKLRKALIKKIKKNPLKALLIAVGTLAAIILIIGYSMKPAPQIDSSAYTHSAAFENCIVADGIDVSYAQGAVDWHKIKEVGVDFAFIRAGFRDTGEGNLHVDERFEENIRAAKKAGLAVGVYYYSQALSKKEAREEANAVLELIEPYDIDLPVMMDYEKFNAGRLVNAISSGQLGTPELTAIAEAWTQTIEDAGYDSGLYANLDFLVHYLDGTGLSNTTNIWTAQYNTYAQFQSDYRFWQCSDSMQLEGTESQYVDRDFWYIPANGLWYSNASDAHDRTSIGECSIKFKKSKFRYYGHNVEPKFKIKNGFRRLREGRDYTVTYVDNTCPGTAYAVIRGVGKYKDTIAEKFVINKFIF